MYKVEAANIKKSLIITDLTDWKWIKFGAVFERVLPSGYFLGITQVPYPVLDW